MAPQPDGKSRPQFSQPFRQITSMIIVIGLCCLGAFMALPRVLPLFVANPILNGFIGGVFLIGVIACFWQVFQLIGSVRWIEGFVSGEIGDDQRATRLLAPLAALLRSRGSRMHRSPSSTRSILDSVATRIDEAREITRYLVSLLIFLGLLGTFYGLATTVPAVDDTIRSLVPSEGEQGAAVFSRLMTGLEAQLGGMGVAFSSSLLGLAGSLVVGLLELFAGHGQNRFYRELEEWLSTITRVGLSSGDEGEGDVSAASAVLDQMAEQMDELTQIIAQSDMSRAMVDQKLADLTDAITAMNARMENNGSITAALERVADGQASVVEAVRSQTVGEGIDAESRMRLRSIDVQMLRILEEISAGRAESMAELRRDIDMLAKALGRPRAAAPPRPVVRRGHEE